MQQPIRCIPSHNLHHVEEKWRGENGGALDERAEAHDAERDSLLVVLLDWRAARGAIVREQVGRRRGAQTRREA